MRKPILSARFLRDLAILLATGFAGERNQRAGRMWWGRLIVKTIFAAAIGLCCGWGLISILDKLIN